MDDRAPLLERIAELEAERDRLRHNVRRLRTVLEAIRSQVGFVLDPPAADTPHVREGG